MHIADVQGGNLGANAIVAGGIPIATGAALSIKKLGQSRIALSFFGDGAVNEGAFHESLNMAAIWKLPVIYFCENNQYAMSMSSSASIPTPTISERAAAYAMPGETVDGNDFGAVAEAVHRAAERARAGEGPTLIEAVTYRYKGHSKSDRNRYRSQEEIDTWRQHHDPIDRFERELSDLGIVDQGEITAMREAAEAEIQAAIEFAKDSPEPSVESLLDYVYAQ
jgi:pyruvate dehydrogenase E1 component alpha subunit